MKRNSLFTKLFAMVLCLALAISCLPLSAFAANDWEGDIDVVEPAEPEAPAVGLPEIKWSALSLGNSLTMCFRMDPTVYAAYENVYVEFTYAGNTTIVSECYADPSSGRITFDFAGIAPNAMNYEISAVVYGTYQGHEFSGPSYSRSVSGYCRTLWDTYTAYNMLSDTLATLIVDVLQYGAAAQIYDNVDVNNLATSVLTAEELARGTAADPVVNNIQDFNYVVTEGATASITNVGLVLDKAVTVRFKVNVPTTENVTLKLECQGLEWEIDGSEFELISGNDYYVYFRGLHGRQMRAEVYATVYQDGEAISNQAITSIESYAARAISAYGSYSAYANLINLLKALIRYGDSNIAYAGA